MKKIGLLLALFAVSSAAAFGQAFTLITANKLVDGTHAPLTGQICFVGTDATDTPITYTPAGSSTVTAGTQICGRVTAGLLRLSIAGVQLAVANPATSDHPAMVYRLTLTDVTGTATYLTLPLTAVSGATWAFDNYYLPAAIVASGQGNPIVNCQPGAQYSNISTPGQINWVCSKLTTDGTIVWTQNPAGDNTCNSNGWAKVSPQYGSPYCLPPHEAYALPGQTLQSPPGTTGPIQMRPAASGGVASASGDASGTASGGNLPLVVQKINGTSVPTNSSANQIPVTTAPATAAWASLPDCHNSNQAVTFDATLHTFACNTIAGSGALPSTPNLLAGNNAGGSIPGNRTIAENTLGYNPLPTSGSVDLTSPVVNGGCGLVADGNLDIPGGLGIGFPVPTGTDNGAAFAACAIAHPGAVYTGAGKFYTSVPFTIIGGGLIGKGMCYNGTTTLGNGCTNKVNTTIITPQGVDGLVVVGQDVEVANLNVVGSNPFAVNTGSRDLSKVRLPDGQYMSFWQYAAVSPFPADATRSSNIVRIPLVNQYYLADGAAVRVIGMAPNALNGVHRITRAVSPDVNSRFSFVSPGADLTNTQMGTGVGFIAVDTPGTGYSSCTATISGGGGTGALASCTASGGAVIAVTTTNAGATPFTSQPTVTITGPGTGATAHAVNQAATGPWSGMLIEPATTGPYNDVGIRITSGVKAKIHNVSVSNHSRSCIAADGSANADDIQLKDYWTTGCGLAGTELGLGADTSAASIEHGNNYQNGITGTLIGDFLGSTLAYMQHSYNFGGAALANGGVAAAYTSCPLVSGVASCHQVAHGLVQGNAFVMAGSSVSSLNAAAGTATAFVSSVSGPDDFTFAMPDAVADTTITGGTIRPASQDEFYNLVGIFGGSYIHGIKGSAGTSLYLHPYIEGAQTGGQAAGTNGYFTSSALIIAPHFGDTIAGSPGVINQDPIFGMSFYSSQHMFVGSQIHYKTTAGGYPVSQGAPNSFANADMGVQNVITGQESWSGGFGSSGIFGPFFKMPTSNFISNYCLKNAGGQLFEQACLKGAPFLLNYMSTNFDEQPDHTVLAGTVPAITATGNAWSAAGGNAFQYFQGHAEVSFAGCCTSIDVGKKDITLTTTLIRAPVGVAVFIVRYTDNNNYVALNISTTTVSITDVIAGTPTTVATASAPASVLGTSFITINAKAVTATVNGVMLSGNLPGGSTNLTATKVAIGDSLGGTQIGNIFVNGIPLTGTPSGTTTTFATVTGPVTNAHIATWDANGNLQDGGTGGGGGFTNPMIAAGDEIIGGVSGAATRLAAGANGTVHQVVSGSPAWVVPSGTGTPVLQTGPVFSGHGNALNTCRAQTYTAGGTITQFSLVVINTSAQMITASTSGGGVYGVAQAAATVGNPVAVCIDGVSSLLMDATSVVGDIVSPSTSTGGQGHDTAQTSRNSIGYQTGAVGDLITGCTGAGCTATVSLEGINRVGRQLPATVVLNNQTNTYGAGLKQVVQASATTAGLQLAGVSADPSGAVAGDVWYRTDLGQVSIRGVSAVLRLLATTGSGPFTIGGPTSSSAPTAPASGSDTAYFTTGGVWTVIDSTSTIVSNAVIPLSSAASGQVVQWIGPDGTQHTTPAISLSVANSFTAAQTFSGGLLGSGIRSVTTASDTLLASDSSGAVRYSFATAITLTVPQAGTAGFGTGYFVLLKNTGVGNLVITPTTSTIEGNATSTLATGQTTLIYSDGSNYREFGGKGAATNVANTWAFKQTYQGGNFWLQSVNTQTTGSPYTVAITDEARLLLINSASAYAVTLPVASTAGYTSGSFFYVSNKGAGTVTITPTTSTINAAATLVLTTNQSALIFSDGTNYYALATAASGGGGVSLTPAASQTIQASGASTVPLIMKTAVSATADIAQFFSGVTEEVHIDQFGNLVVDSGQISSGGGLSIGSGGALNLKANILATTGDVNLLSAWTGSAVAGTIVAITSGTHAVTTCATSCVNAYGVIDSTPNTNDVVVSAGQTVVNLDAATTITGGWYLCTSATVAGKATAQAAACAAGRQVGYVTANGTTVSVATAVLQFK